MEVIHRIGGNLSGERERRALIKVGIELPPEEFVFLISEDDVRWPSVSELVAHFDLLDFVSTSFTDIERFRAGFLSMDGNWHNGYPQPEDDYQEVSYDLTNYCHLCGVGAVQKAPLRIKSEPKWGRRSIMQLNWIFDELFTPPEVWRSVFRPFGVGCRPVLNRSGVKEFETVMQLVFEGSSPLDTTGLSYETCLVCSRRKYLPNVRGFIPKPLNPVGSAFKSVEDFGSGASASKEVFVAQDLYRDITASKLLGAVFSPCA